MPDIMICGMDMPEGCLSCNLRATSGLDEWMCMVNRMRFPSWEDGWNGDKYRHVDCPLHELPEHGDLIDRDALETDLVIWNGECGDPAFSEEAIDNAPVIVPASEEENANG